MKIKKIAFIVFCCIGVPTFASTPSAVPASLAEYEKKQKEENRISACPNPLLHAQERKEYHEIVHGITSNSPLCLDLARLVARYLPLCCVMQQRSSAPVTVQPSIRTISEKELVESHWAISHPDHTCVLSSGLRRVGGHSRYRSENWITLVPPQKNRSSTSMMIEHITDFRMEGYYATAITYMPNGDLFAITHDSRELYMFDSQRNVRWKREGFYFPHMCVLSNGELLFYVRLPHPKLCKLDTSNGALIPFKEKGKPKYSLSMKEKYIDCMQPLPEGKAALGLSDGSILFLDPTKHYRDIITRLKKGHTRTIKSFALISNTTLVSSSIDGSLIMWDIKSKTIKQILIPPIPITPQHPADRGFASVDDLKVLSEEQIVCIDEQGIDRIWEQEPCVSCDKKLMDPDPKSKAEQMIKKG